MEPAQESPTPLVEAVKISKLKARQQQITDKVERTKADLEERRKSNWIIDTALATVEGDAVAGGPVLAGAVAFRVFLFQVPYVFVIVVAIGALKSSSESISDEIDHAVGIGTLTAQALGGASDLSGWALAWALGVGSFALFLGARTAVKVIRIVHCLVWKIAPTKFNSTRAAFGFIAVVTIALTASSIAQWVRTDTFIGGLLLTIVACGIFGVMFLFVELRMPRPPATTWQDLLPGALLFTVGVLGLHLFTVYWISYSLDNKSDTYGAIGASLSLLLWAYLLGRLITASIVLNHVRWSRHSDIDTAT